MSYQVIARKWRPQTFDDVIGQENITQTLRNALAYGRLHHAYLFSGARGVGKTTTARLLAKALNCHKSDTPTVTPCPINAADVCPSCNEIAESRSIDVLEFDAASHTGVQDIRNIILESINVAAARDRFKVFIIDEVHMLSTSSFNALLKTLEEPPPKVVFIMATTELNKVPETILSRCQEFEFRTIPLVKIFDRLKLIAETEQITISDDALREIARSGEGSMRDAQSNFDQVISFSGESIAVKDVSNALGMASTEMLTGVLTAIGDKNAKQILLIVDELISRGQDLRNFSRDLLSLFRDLLVFKVAGDASNLFDTAVLSADEMKKYSTAFTEADLLRFFNSLSETETRLKAATQTRYTLEIGLVKLIEMNRVAKVEELLERLSKIDATAAVVDTPEKKTLKIERSEPIAPQAPAVVENFVTEEPPHFMEAPPSDNEEHPDFVEADPLEESIQEQTEASKPAYRLDFLDSITLSLPDIDAAELEHFDDNWLDDAYERRLLRENDNLRTVKNAADLLKSALGSRVQEPQIQITDENRPTARVINFTVPETVEFRIEDLPEISKDSTKEQLLAYANQHPKIKLALRLFGGTLLDVEKL